MVVHLLHGELAIAVSGPEALSKAQRMPGVSPSAPSDHLYRMSPLLRVQGLSKEFAAPHGTIRLFDGLDFHIQSGEMVGVVGQSGAGKSTLLHLLGALDAPTSGEVWFDDINLATLTPDAAADFRNRQLGYVWQFHYLLPEFTALENVAMPLLARDMDPAKALDEAAYWLDQVELADRASHRAGELSGGEQQRVALARALVTKPRLLLADEPTGDLDNQTAENVFNLIERLHASHGLTSLLVTHNEGFAQRCTRILRLQSGRLLEEEPSASHRGAQVLTQVQPNGDYV
jgi:lipoprotein-releasing system ATP-binding protein